MESPLGLLRAVILLLWKMCLPERSGGTQEPLSFATGMTVPTRQVCFSLLPPASITVLFDAFPKGIYTMRIHQKGNSMKSETPRSNIETSQIKTKIPDFEAESM